jgi:Domain of unknown function (DUF4351)
MASQPYDAQALFLRQLTRRLGELAPELQSQIQALPLSQLEALGEALLDFSEPEDLLHWLQAIEPDSPDSGLGR